LLFCLSSVFSRVSPPRGGAVCGGSFCVSLWGGGGGGGGAPPPPRAAAFRGTGDGVFMKAGADTRL
ncbi:hypothetical protein GSH05_32430, partial [Burkholderia pseudomallei]|nr:hypothetical protein [Burkholderia pseudomallei]